MAAEKVPLVSSMIVKTWRHFMHDSLRRNASLLMLSQGVNAAAAFIFWIVCAHLFTAATVGLATAFVSFGALVATFTNLGLSNTVTRFLPTSKNRGGLFTASLYLVTASSLLGGILAWALIKILVPKLGFVHASPFLAITLLFIITLPVISSLFDGALMAFRKGEYVLGKTLLTSLPRVALPFFVLALGLRGITGTYVIVFVLGILYNAFVIFRKLLKNERLGPKLTEIKKHWSYAAGNYFGGMFGILPTMLVPIIVLNRLGAESAAYFYMPVQIVTFLGMISSSVSSALIAECSQSDDDAEYRNHFRNAFVHLYRILVPLVVALWLLGWPILLIYGKAYAQYGIVPLFILVGTGLLEGSNWLGDTWLNIQKRSRAYFLMNALNALAVTCFVYVLAPHGLVAASFGWILGQAATTVVYLIIFGRDGLLPSKLQFSH